MLLTLRYRLRVAASMENILIARKTSSQGQGVSAAILSLKRITAKRSQNDAFLTMSPFLTANFIGLRLFGSALTVLHVTLAYADVTRMILPNSLNALLAGIGFVQSLILDLPPLPEAAAGAMFGSGLFFLVGAAFCRLRGYAGLGLGDVKFAGAAGLWIGLQGVPIMILAASVSALMYVALRALFQFHFDRRAPLPFGPFLCVGTLFTWLFNSVTPA